MIDLSKWNMPRLCRSRDLLDGALKRDLLPNYRADLTGMLNKINAEILKRVQTVCDCDAAKRGIL